MDSIILKKTSIWHTFPSKHEMDFVEADLDDDKTFLTRHLDI